MGRDKRLAELEKSIGTLIKITECGVITMAEFELKKEGKALVEQGQAPTGQSRSLDGYLVIPGVLSENDWLQAAGKWTPERDSYLAKLGDETFNPV